MIIETAIICHLVFLIVAETVGIRCVLMEVAPCTRILIKVRPISHPAILIQNLQLGMGVGFIGIRIFVLLWICVFGIAASSNS